MIDKIKELVRNNYGVKHYFRFRGIRNQVDEFSGKIVAVYPEIFIIKVDDCYIKSFSYSDLLINNLEIIDL